ncbi:hypothetical protein CsatA_024544 [Cannabis sativa]
MRFFSSHGKPPCPNNSSSPIHFSLSNVLYEKFRRITKIQRSKAFVKYRIQNEIRNTKLNPPTHISYGKVVDHDYFHFQGAIIGPCDTPFEGGVFFVSIKMPYNYPFKPPKVVFLTKIALYYAKQLLKLEAGSNVKGYSLLARVLSAQKRFGDAETVINAAIEQTGKWDHGELLRTKAKLQIEQDQLKNAIETYTHLLALLQVRSKSASAEKRILKTRRKNDRGLEMETWHDLAKLYMSLSQWTDAEVCLSKSQVTACILRLLGGHPLPVVKSFLMDALRIDRANHYAWYNLGASPLKAAECFEAAALLERRHL